MFRFLNILKMETRMVLCVRGLEEMYEEMFSSCSQSTAMFTNLPGNFFKALIVQFVERI